jgi:hypothetical protein
MKYHEFHLGLHPSFKNYFGQMWSVGIPQPSKGNGLVFVTLCDCFGWGFRPRFYSIVGAILCVCPQKETPGVRPTTTAGAEKSYLFLGEGQGEGNLRGWVYLGLAQRLRKNFGAE